MRIITFLLALSMLVFSCKKGSQDSATALQDSLSVLVDSTTNKYFEVVFDDDKGMLHIRMTGTKKIIPIGSYHNTFNQPPHEIKIEILDYQNFAIMIFTNQIQLGISQDNINVIGFNLSTEKTAELCSFYDLGVYSQDTGIDTLTDIKLHDYQLTKVDKNGYFKMEVTEYKPYKYEDENKNTNLKINTNKRVCAFSLDEAEDDTDSVLLIRLSDDISIHWNNKSQDIVNDALLSSIRASFTDIKQNLVDQILNTSVTPARICSTKRNLVVGDMAFLLIDKIKDVPFFQVFGIQCDFFERDCKYPYGMFDYMNNYREEAKSKLELYLTSH
jgi:hypothetical protein